MNQPNPTFASLRLSQNFGQSLGVKKVLTTVPVTRPSKDRFFRVCESTDWVYPAWVLENKGTGETFIVSEEVASVLAGLARPVELYSAVDRQDNLFFIPVPLPGPNGLRNPWHESLLHAIIRARTVWLRISANRDSGAYDIYEATAKLSEPTWPDATMEELLEIAFRGRIIASVDHPVVQEKLGGV